MTIQNESVKIEARDGGLFITDLQRGTEWHLEECSAVYGGAILWNEFPCHGWQNELKNMAMSRAALLNENELQVFYAANRAEISYVYKLLPDSFEVRLLADNTSGIETISMPGSFAPVQGGKKLLLPIMQGMLWDGRGQELDHIARSGGHGGFSMQMYGVLAENSGLLCAAEESVDSRWRYTKDSDGFRAYNLAVSTLGKIEYERVIRFHFTQPTITAIAKRYRKCVIDGGRFVTWEEKIKERPHLERLFGALMCYIGYSQDDIDYVRECEKLREMGFERALIYPVAFNTYNLDFEMGGLPPIKISDEDIEKIKALGYDVSPWSWLNEAIESKNPAAAFKVNRNGERIFGWQIDEYKWYKMCSSYIEEYSAQAVEGEFKAMTWDHYDVFACATIGECYDKTHENHKGRKISRREDLQIIRRVLENARGSNENGRIVSAEGFDDLFSMEYDIGSVKAWPQYGPWAFWPVPLTGLVYHDSIMHSWWEVHNYNSCYFNREVQPDLYEYGGGRTALQSAMDALYGAPPDVFPFGAQYGWTGRGAETFIYRFRLEDECVQDALKQAFPVKELHKKIGKLEMTDFEFLSGNGWVQKTTFADGTKVFANFSNIIVRNIPEAGDLMPHSWKTITN